MMIREDGAPSSDDDMSPSDDHHDNSHPRERQSSSSLSDDDDEHLSLFFIEEQHGRRTISFHSCDGANWHDVSYDQLVEFVETHVVVVLLPGLDVQHVKMLARVARVPAERARSADYAEMAICSTGSWANFLHHSEETEHRIVLHGPRTDGGELLAASLAEFKRGGLHARHTRTDSAKALRELKRLVVGTTGRAASTERSQPRTLPANIAGSHILTLGDRNIFMRMRDDLRVSLGFPPLMFPNPGLWICPLCGTHVWGKRLSDISKLLEHWDRHCNQRDSAAAMLSRVLEWRHENNPRTPLPQMAEIRVDQHLVDDFAPNTLADGSPLYWPLYLANRLIQRRVLRPTHVLLQPLSVAMSLTFGLDSAENFPWWRFHSWCVITSAIQIGLGQCRS